MLMTVTSEKQREWLCPCPPPILSSPLAVGSAGQGLSAYVAAINQHLAHSRRSVCFSSCRRRVLGLF